MNLLLRLIIIVVASLLIWQFADGFSLNAQILVHLDAGLHNILSAFSEGVLGNVLAIAAIVLAAFNKHLRAATLTVGLAVVFFYLPYLTFFIAIMIHGF